MITYNSARDRLQSGDVLGTKGRNIIGRLIRMASAETINHVALVHRDNDGVWVTEMQEGKGYVGPTPASQWIRDNNAKGKHVFWGQFPGELRGHSCHQKFAKQMEGTRYAWWTFPLIFVSQFVPFIKAPEGYVVCSTYVQMDWEIAKYAKMEGSADPGNFFSHANNITRIV